MEKETFYFGNTKLSVTVTNPNSYLDKNLLGSRKGLEEYINKNNENYDSIFRELANLSQFSISAKSNLEQIIEEVREYISTIDVKDLIKETGLSRTTCVELKSGKRNISNLKVENLLKIYSRKVNRINDGFWEGEKMNLFEHEYLLPVESEKLTHISVIVHFCNIFNTDDIFNMYKFLSVRITPSKKLLYKTEANAPFKKFIVVNYKKYFKNGLCEEISENELKSILSKVGNF